MPIDWYLVHSSPEGLNTSTDTLEMQTYNQTNISQEFAQPTEEGEERL